MRVKIKTKLDAACSARLRKKAKRYWSENNVSALAFMHVGRSTYAPIHESWEDREDEVRAAHSLARHMMVVAGTTFNYDVV